MLKKILEFNNGLFLLSDGTAVEPSQIKGSPRVGLSVNEKMEITHGDVDPDCPGGSCPIK